MRTYSWFIPIRWCLRISAIIGSMWQLLRLHLAKRTSIRTHSTYMFTIQMSRTIMVMAMVEISMATAPMAMTQIQLMTKTKIKMAMGTTISRSQVLFAEMEKSMPSSRALTQLDRWRSIFWRKSLFRRTSKIWIGRRSLSKGSQCLEDETFKI